MAIISQEKKQLGKIHFIFCSDKYLLQLNQQFLRHDEYTDIITFDYSQGPILSAEIYISIDRVKENAQQFGVSFDKELQRVMAHGILHLAGYKDKCPEQRAVMRRREDECLRLMGQLKGG